VTGPAGLIPWPLRVALLGLVLDGLVALYLGTFIGPGGFLLLAGLVVASWWAPALGRLVPGGLAPGRVVVPLAAAASVLDALFIAPTMVDALVRLLGFVLLYRLFTMRTVAETRTVAFLAFFMLVAASASAFGVGYLFVLVVFVALATGVLLLQHALQEAEPGPRRRVHDGSLVDRAPARLGMLALLATGGIVVLAGAFFATLPRIGLAALPLRVSEGTRVSGFSDRVELGAFGPILLDDTVVMRVHLEDEVDPDRLPTLRWRGVALDHFDGTTWSAWPFRRMRPLRNGVGGVRLGYPRGSGPVIRQEVFLDPIASDVLFAAPRALALGLRSDIVTQDDGWAITVARAQARLAYTVQSELEAGPGEGLGGVLSDPETRLRYVQLPRLDPRVADLARGVTAGAAGPRDAALRLSGYLSREYRYTLDVKRQTALSPVEEFLFVRREGHCEYFAAALAVLLRSLDIPARVVNGFQRGEWNPYGHHFLVRLRDAHSWVEAHVEGRGWITLDPSPRAAAEVRAAPSRLAQMLDAVRLHWHRYVIQWSLGDQVRAAAELQRQTAALGAAARDAGRRAGRLADLPPALGGLLAAAVGAGLLGLALRWRRGGAGASAAAWRPPAFYRQALALLARRGLVPSTAETAEEFAERAARGLAPAGPGEAVPARASLLAITRAYERARFGGRTPDAGAAAEIEQALGRLGAIIRVVRPPPARPGR
jgi:transglutaminase-like putative cysteine protease